MEVDGHEAADNEAIEAGKDKDRRLMGEGKETEAKGGGGRGGENTNEYKRKYYS